MEARGKKVAILVEDVYEDPELWYLYYRMQEAGAEVTLVGPEAGATYESKHGYPAVTDAVAEDLEGIDFDAVIVPVGSPRTRCAAPKRWFDSCGRPTRLAKSSRASAMVPGCSSLRVR